MAGTSLSVVIPVFNEAASLLGLFEEVTDALLGLDVPYEILFVDDGSTDASPRVLQELAAKDPAVKLIAFRRNFGQTAAMMAGIEYAQGDVIVVMDGDGQNDPADIPRLLDRLAAGFDVVSGWRRERKDARWRRVVPSRIANSLISWISGVHLHDYGCTLKAYRQEVLTGFRLYGEMHRFIPAYADSVGAKITEMPVRHHPRKFGKTKYGLTRTMKVILDLFTVKFLISYANKPIYLFGGTGIILITVSLSALLFLLVRRILYSTSVTASPFFTTSMMVLILGFQSILMGLIAELLVRTYHESQHKPTYTVRKLIAPPKGLDNR